MGLLSGKRGLIMGVANERSAAWGIAKAAAEAGAEIAYSYQGEGLKSRVAGLAEKTGSSLLFECDASTESGVADCFAALRQSWDSLDFVVHGIAFSDKSELKGAYLNTSRDNFAQTMRISCYSFTDVAKQAQAMMPNGGALLTLSYLGGVRITPNYNVMGVAKAGLESSVRYLAVDLGGQNIRVNGLSAGPMRTLSGAAITGARHIFRHSEENAPLGRNPDIDEVGRSALYLISDLSSGVTGEIHYCDGGFHHIGVAKEPSE